MAVRPPVNRLPRDMEIAKDLRPAGLGAFACLSDELLARLLQLADVRSLANLGTTSKLWRLLCCEEPVWLELTLTAFRRPLVYRVGARLCAALLGSCLAQSLVTVCIVCASAWSFLQGSWRETYASTATGRPVPQRPPAPVAGFSSTFLYRWGGRGGRLGLHARFGCRCAWLSLHFATGAVDPTRPHLPPAVAAAPLPPTRTGCRRWFRCNVDLSTFTPPATGIPSVSNAGQTLTPQQFDQHYDLPNQPVMLGSLAASWNLAAWQPEALGRRLGGVLVKVTKPGVTGGRTRMRLVDYLAYSAAQRDEEPLYIFDS